MEITHHHPATGVVTIAVRGELDLETAPDLEKAVRDLLADAELRAMDVDLTEVGFCDSSGIAVLDLGYHTAARQNVRFRVTGIRPPVRRVFEIVGILDALTGA